MFSDEERKARKREYNRKYYEAHKDEHREYKRKYYEAHKDEHREYQRKYREAHKDKINAKRRARKRTERRAQNLNDLNNNFGGNLTVKNREIKNLKVYPVGRRNGFTLFAAVDENKDIYIQLSAITKIVYGASTGGSFYSASVSSNYIHIPINNVISDDLPTRYNCNNYTVFIKYQALIEVLDTINFEKRSTYTTAQNLKDYLRTCIYPKIQNLIKQGKWGHDTTMDLNFEDDTPSGEQRVTQPEPTANNTELVETIRAIIQSEIANAAYGKRAIEQPKPEVKEPESVDMSKYISCEIAEANFKRIESRVNSIQSLLKVLHREDIDNDLRLTVIEALFSGISNIKAINKATLCNEKANFKWEEAYFERIN